MLIVTICIKVVTHFENKGENMDKDEKTERDNLRMRTAMMTLLTREPFEKITVTEFCREANISRMTFYRRYDSLKQLLSEVALTYVEWLRQSVDESLRRDPYSYYVSLFQKIRDNAETVLMLYSANVFEFLFRQDDRISYLSYENFAYNGAIHSVAYAWLRAGMPQSPEEMAKICLKITGKRQVFMF